jgi:hypothetical protein
MRDYADTFMDLLRLSDLKLIEWSMSTTNIITNVRHVWRGECAVLAMRKKIEINSDGEISSSHGGEYDVQNCLLGHTAV